MDVISQLRGVIIYENGAVELRGVHCAVSTQPTAVTCENSGTSLCKVNDKDFTTSLKGRKWTVVWNWTREPSTLKNKVGCYETFLKGEERAEFDRAIECWIEEVIFAPWDKDGSVTINGSGSAHKEQGPASSGLSRAE